SGESFVQNDSTWADMSQFVIWFAKISIKPKKIYVIGAGASGFDARAGRKFQGHVCLGRTSLNVETDTAKTWGVEDVPRKKPISGLHRQIDPAQSAQRALAQTCTNGIADDERANKGGTADDCAEQHAQMRARVEAKAAAGEGAKGHEGNSKFE